MSLGSLVAGLLLIAVALGVAGARRRGVRWRSWTIALQPLSALLLYAALLPPSLPRPAETLVVLSPQGTRTPVETLFAMQPAVTLPGVPLTAAATPVPDLATALRQQPQTRQIEVRGDGLPLRDREALGARGLRFKPSEERGLLELNAPGTVALGTQWPLGGRVARGVAQLELHDPAGAMVDTARPDAEGRFGLSGVARAEGPARFELRLLDAAAAVVDRITIPVVATRGMPPRVIVRAGAPDPEFKYWRRWASDAGLALRVRAGLSEKLDLRDGDTALTPSALEQIDLVVLDERAWRQLDAAEKSALSAAVRDGLGLLLRLGGEADPAAAADWAALGVQIGAADAHGVTIDRRTGLRDRAAFNVAPASAALADAIPLLQADDGEVLASWRALGQGRVGVWRLLDSYRLGLLGEPARYGALWSQTIATLARPGPAAAVAFDTPDEAWVDERLTICGLGQRLTLTAPQGQTADVPVTGGCAALWPVEAGWYRAQSAGASAAFYVRAADDGGSLRAARDRRETLRLAHEDTVGDDATLTVERPLPRALLWLLWLGVSAALWWRERPYRREAASR